MGRWAAGRGNSGKDGAEDCSVSGDGWTIFRPLAWVTSWMRGCHECGEENLKGIQKGHLAYTELEMLEGYRGGCRRRGHGRGLLREPFSWLERKGRQEGRKSY